MHETPASFCSIESPLALSAGWQPVRGWLVAKPGHHFVDVRARVGTREFPGVYGFPRADLADFFKAGRPWLPAEFIIEIEFAPGVAEVRLEALDLAGEWQAVKTFVFEIQATATPATRPPRDPVSAVEFGRATRLSYLQRSSVIPPWPRMVRVGYAPFQGYLAQPHALAKGLYGRVQVLGWLFHDTQRLKRVFATTDLLTLQPMELGGEFDGVRARYNHPHVAESLFKGMVDVSSRLPAPATIRIFAELADGSVHLCLASRCRPVTTEELKLSWPPYAPLKFWRHWRAARKQLQAAGLPLETGAGLRKEFWASLREYRALASPKPQAGASHLGSPMKGGPLRLLLVTHNLNLEGAPLLFAEYAAHLVQTGARVTVLAGQEGPLREHFIRAGATVRVLDADPAAAANPDELHAALNRLSLTLDWDDIDLVVANTVMSFWGVLLARHHAGRPALFYIHESNPPALFFQRTTPALLPAAHEAFRRATAVSFNTPATQAYYAGLGSGKNFHLNPAWIDVAAIDAFRAAHPRAALRTQLGLRDGELLVANIGTVCERKGQHDFLRAIEWLARLDPALVARCRFLMVGGRDTPYDREIDKDLAVLNRPNVQVVKETTRAFDYFAAADVFVCTSYEESFPRVVLEAMAFEVPVVSTNVHGIPYMLRDGTDAALVNPGDIAALAAALRQTLGDPSVARTRTASARARVGEFDAKVLLPQHARFTARVAATRA